MILLLETNKQVYIAYLSQIDIVSLRLLSGSPKGSGMSTRILSQQKYFVVEGNIGVGKSTFLRLIKDRLNVQVVFEPIARWQDVGGSGNLLEKFYNDTARWAYSFQSYAFITRILEQEASSKTAGSLVQVLERSVFSDRYCFAKNAYELGTMSALEWQMYQDWFSWLVEHHLQKPVGFIYLMCDPEVSYERLKKRNRFEEVPVTLDYLRLLEAKHKQWLVEKKDVTADVRDIPVLVLDCSGEFETDKAVQEQFFAKITHFIQQHHMPGAVRQPFTQAML